jgi:hypothetical protein
MRIARSWLSNGLAGIAIACGLAFLNRTMGGASSGSTPERQPTDGDAGQQAASAIMLPRHGESLRPGWGRPEPEKIPRPTYWPMVFGLGIAFLSWGLISNIFILVFGIILLVVALVGWVVELVVEFRD